jgi:hypothetical protein
MTPSAWRQSAAVDRQLIPFLEWLLPRHAEQGGLTEIRVLQRARGVWSAIVTPDDLYRIPDWLGPDGPGPGVGEANVYFGLNPVDPSRHQPHPLTRSRTAVRDAHIRRFSLLAVDIDPVRATGLSATDREKHAAQRVADQVSEWLGQQGARPLTADSGNGYHLLVPLVPNDDVRTAAASTRSLLHLLHERFSTDAAVVDRSTFNPSRILKLYGTVAAKGVATEERPHRVAAIDLSDIPEDVDLFASLAVEPQARTTSRSSNSWSEWRREALSALDLDAVYAEWLTGRSRQGWLECRDPWAESGDANPSAGIADGTGTAERGTFHSFRTGDSLSVFDFLTRRGEAATFADACDQVAAWTGIRRSGSRPPSTEAACSAWKRAGSAQTRNRLLRGELGRVAKLPALEQHQALDTVRQHTGLSLQVLRKTLREQKRPSLTPVEASNRPIVDWVTNRDRVDDLLRRLVDALLPFQRLFRTGEDMVFIERGVGPRRVTERTLIGKLASLVELRFLNATDDEVRLSRYDVLPGSIARAFVHAPAVRVRLPELVRYTRSPLFASSWSFVGTPGFHADSGTFYDGPVVEPLEGTSHLDELLADVHWLDLADRINFLGAALTTLTMPHWGRGHPFLAINGNKPGVGKSTLARLLGVLAEGHEPSSISWLPDDNEFEKQIATRVDAGDRVLVIDNAKTRRPIQSAVLERCITDTRLNFRRLGSNSSISRPENDLLFVLTMNLTQMGPDLRRRALPVNLSIDDNVRDVSYAIDDVVGWALKHRLALLGELAGLVADWVAAGRPVAEDAARHSTSQAWAGAVDGMLRHAGLVGFLSNFEAAEHQFDPRYLLMREVAEQFMGHDAAPAAGWVPRLEPWLRDRFVDRHGRERTDRAKATIVGSLFRDYLDATLEVDGQAVRLVREHPDGPTRSPVYRFVETASM